MQNAAPLITRLGFQHLVWLRCAAPCRTMDGLFGDAGDFVLQRPAIRASKMASSFSPGPAEMTDSHAENRFEFAQRNHHDRDKPPRVSCREIAEKDFPALADLLARGFPCHTAGSWREVLDRLSAHRTPPRMPRYGFLLESNAAPVGAVLTIFSEVDTAGRSTIRCNLSSWYVEPEFRCYASLLQPRGSAYRDITFVNITPARHTLPLLEAQGFVQYSSGQFISMPTARGPWNVRVEPCTTDLCAGSDLSASVVELLLIHASYGCISVTCHDTSGRYAFVFKKWQPIRGVPSVYLIYCQSVENFVRFAGPLGRFLARRGFPLIVLDADGPLSGLFGKFLDDQPKLSKGPNPPRLGDLAYTERALFSF
jgi:hypothetical protein